jgi:hypothetical protein
MFKAVSLKGMINCKPHVNVTYQYIKTYEKNAT